MPVDQVAPTINMSKLLRQLGHRTGQSRKVVFYREPIYGKDSYGVENTTIAVNEIVVPEVQAYIRTQISKDFVIQKGGGNIIGSALIYLPRLNTLKNFPNLDQDNNVYFNEIEGWDKIIDKDRVVYSVPTSGTAGWADEPGDLVFSSDGESITISGSGPTVKADYTHTSTQNILESDRIAFQLKASGSVTFSAVTVYDTNTSSDNSLVYQIASDITIPSGSWYTIDLPFLSGTTATSSYLNGARSSYTITSGNTFKFTDSFKRLRFKFDDLDTGEAVYMKGVKFYKSTEWSVHSVRDYTDEYMCLECVRTAGKRDSRRRAYA